MPSTVWPSAAPAGARGAPTSRGTPSGPVGRDGGPEPACFGEDVASTTPMTTPATATITTATRIETRCRLAPDVLLAGRLSAGLPGGPVGTEPRPSDRDGGLAVASPGGRGRLLLERVTGSPQYEFRVMRRAGRRGARHDVKGRGGRPPASASVGRGGGPRGFRPVLRRGQTDRRDPCGGRISRAFTPAGKRVEGTRYRRRRPGIAERSATPRRKAASPQGTNPGARRGDEGVQRAELG